MKTWAVLAAKHATLTSGVSFSVIPGLGTSSLDGFALGALLAGAYFAAVNSPRRGLGDPRLPVRASRRQAWLASRSPVVMIRSRRDPQAGAQGDHMSLASAPLCPVPVRPAFLAAPPDLPERDELSRPYSLQLEPTSLPAPSGLDCEAPVSLSRPEPGTALPGVAVPEPVSELPGTAAPEPVLPSRPLWLPRQAERPEDSRPYASPASAGWPEAIRPELAPALAGQSAIRRLSRLRRRIDSMLVEMLGDESDERERPSQAEPDEGFWGPGERTDSTPTIGYRSKHRLTDPAREPRRPDGQHNVPRHAAPPASFSARLTGRYAAHAAW